MGLFSYLQRQSILDDERRAREEYQRLLGASPQTALAPQEGPVRPGEFLPPINQTTQGSGLLGGPTGQNYVSPQEFLLKTAGMPGQGGPNALNVANSGLLGGGGAPKYKDIKINPITGQAFGVNESTGTFEPMKTPVPFPKGFTVQGVGEGGAPTQEIAFPSLMGTLKGGRIQLSQKGYKPLPSEAQDSLSQAFDAFDALDVMKKNMSETGVITGRVSQAQAALGFNQPAIDFDTGRNNMKLAAQALIKGIPSNFDVQTMVNTLPALGLPESVNKSREDFSRKLLKNLVKRTVAYYKGTGHNIPPGILKEAQKRGIDIGATKPWDGQGDPLEGVAEESKDANYFKKKYGLK